jgi:hypothetical protein
MVFYVRRRFITVLKRVSSYSILSHFNSVHTLTSYFVMININIILPYKAYGLVSLVLSSIHVFRPVHTEFDREVS